MKATIVLSRTNCTPVEAWVEYKNIEVELPIEPEDGWHIVGGIVEGKT